ncbi:MFS transporter [Amycolatopsis endophytica]|uniref:ACS family tartrate transporter-like MFS transporter n=1 Tax=Amycolatopsis endophytica TaxID=860233 RepID=A0A853B616_9PSEU|nr:MFS transporter [Amycolatopsis endophytica]NYI90683.1 ACS family tartrate transporter-like MFS transporter [Amycolatopsis endophytica]
MTTADTAIEASVIRKLTWRFLPFLGLCYIVLYMDRLNIGVAALTMNADLGLSATAFGLAAGIYFWSYTVCEVPSNLVLAKVGARRWIPRIMITWGLVTIGTAFVQGAGSLSVARVLLGIAEAGFSPGALYFVTRWFPYRARARAMGWIITCICLSGVTAPISAHLLELDGLAGLAGWRWLFVITGIPAVIMGFLCYRVLRDRPADAKWLTPEERTWLERTMDAEHRRNEQRHSMSILRGLTDVRVLVLCLVFLTVTFGLNGYSIWMPQILATFGWDKLAIGWIGAIPPLLAIVPMLLWTRRSDRRRERVWHFAIPMLVSAAGFLYAAANLHTPLAAMAGFSLAAIGLYAAMSIFFLLPSAMLSGVAAAAGLALINGLGNLGGFFGPQVTGIIKDATGSFVWAVIAFGLVLALGAALAVALSRNRAMREALSDHWQDQEAAALAAGTPGGGK